MVSFLCIFFCFHYLLPFSVNKNVYKMSGIYCVAVYRCCSWWWPSFSSVGRRCTSSRRGSSSTTPEQSNTSRLGRWISSTYSASRPPAVIPSRTASWTHLFDEDSLPCSAVDGWRPAVLAWPGSTMTVHSQPADISPPLSNEREHFTRTGTALNWRTVA